MGSMPLLVRFLKLKIGILSNNFQNFDGVGCHHQLHVDVAPGHRLSVRGGSIGVSGGSSVQKMN